uniref:Uncharacterized protein n=1 Tax=Cannabis sativa TaxID=3483 RepID=A0A803QBU8_CANSA
MAVTRSRSSSLSPSPKKLKKKSIKQSKFKSVAQITSKPPNQKSKVVVDVGEPSSGDAKKAKRKRNDNEDDFIVVRPRKINRVDPFNPYAILFTSKSPKEFSQESLILFFTFSEPNPSKVFRETNLFPRSLVKHTPIPSSYQWQS